MLRRLVVVALLVGSLAPSFADDPKPSDLAKKPQWQRMLTGEDAKKAQLLEDAIGEQELSDDYAKAIRSGKELLALRTKAQGADHHETIVAKFELSRLEILSAQSAEKRREWRNAGLGLVLAQALMAQGQYSKAYADRKRYVDVCRELLGEDHPRTATSYNNLGYNQAVQGKTAEAVQLYRKALDISRKVLGEEHPDTAMSYNNVASSLLDQGNAAEAVILFRKALEIFRKVVGEDHADTAMSYNNVGMNLNALGKTTEAGPLLQKALDIRRKVLGEDNHYTAMSYNNVAFNLSDRGKGAEAGLLFGKALEIFRKVLGEDHLDTAIGYNNVGTNLDAEGKLAEAGPFHQKALEIRRKVLGEGHPVTATSYNNIATNQEAQGKAAEAEPLLRKALDIRRKHLGEDNPLTALSYSNLAYNLDVQEKAAESEPFGRKALEIRRKVFGEDHAATAMSYNNVAMNLNAQGKTAEAEPLLRKALEIRLKILGENHADTASSYNSVAFNLNTQGKTAEAVPLFRKGLDIRIKVLGVGHPHTAISYNNVAAGLHAQGDTQQADAVLAAAIPVFESSRLVAAQGIDRANFTQFNPRLLLASYLQNRDPAAAWTQLEYSLARGLLDQQTKSGTTRLTPDEQRDREAALTRLTAIEPRLLKLVATTKLAPEETLELEQLLAARRALEVTVARLAVAESERAVAPPDRIRTALPADAALLYWADVASGDNHEHWACVVRRTGDAKWARLPGTGPDGKWSKDDTALPERLRTALVGTTEFREVESLAKQLHAQRIAPVLKHLDGVKTLYAVPVNWMAGIPIEALTGDFTIGYVPSGSYLARLKDRSAPKGHQLLAIGDPVFDSGGKTQAVASKSLPPGGLLVMQVVPESTGAKARIQAGDVLLKYNDVELTDLDKLKTAIVANEKTASNTVTIWRETSMKPTSREVAVDPGRLGVVLDLDPAPLAMANRRKLDAQLANIRRGEWQELPGTRVETTRLQQLFGDSAKVLTDGAASEQQLDSLRKSGELSKYRYLHFATHGDGNNAVAFESSIILSQDNLPKDNLPKAAEPWINGQLSAREVLEYWKLDAELVTLSACETAIGKKGGGDGLLGFAQAFLTVGARSVCLSLWKVNDAATALLMGRFYENLLGKRAGLAKPMGKAAALDEAKRWLRNLSGEEALTLTAKINDGVARGTRGKVALNVAPHAKRPLAKDAKPFAHPTFWAAFILVGDPN